MKAGLWQELGVEGVIRDTISGCFERFVCVHVCERVLSQSPLE